MAAGSGETNKEKRALILGISGQDGAYLGELLLKNGYEVFGTSRDAEVSSFDNLLKIGIRNRVKVESVAINDFRSVLQTIVKVRPTEIYNLAGQSSVGLSFQQPVETLESHGLATLNILEAIRFTSLPCRLYNAGSSECFGDTGDAAADEKTSFHPRSPYAVAKATAFWEVANYREAYGLFACSGILFNHESPLRSKRFVTRKIVSAAYRIAMGDKEPLRLGNLDVQRDWGWAAEYVEAMWLMLQQNSPSDFIISTGKSYHLEEFVSEAFRFYGLDWKNHVQIDKNLFRPSDLRIGRGNPEKAAKQLGWRAKHDMHSVVRMMCEAESKHNENAYNSSQSTT